MKKIISIEMRPSIKTIGAVIQSVGMFCVIFGIINLIINFMPKIIIILALGLYFVGMILGAKIEKQKNN